MSCFRGAAQGEGLGNAFLSNISAVDGIFHVLRPVEDMHIIHGELRAKDIERVDKFIDVRRFSFRAICADTS
jgi:obg-like ATPase 1